MSHSPAASGRVSVFADAVAAIMAPFAGVFRFVRREFEMARAEHHLDRLNDDVLKDIGVHRSQIHAALRHGKCHCADQCC